MPTVSPESASPLGVRVSPEGPLTSIVMLISSPSGSSAESSTLNTQANEPERTGVPERYGLAFGPTIPAGVMASPMSASVIEPQSME